MSTASILGILGIALVIVVAVVFTLALGDPTLHGTVTHPHCIGPHHTHCLPKRR